VGGPADGACPNEQLRTTGFRSLLADDLGQEGKGRMKASNDNRSPRTSARPLRMFQDVWHRCARTPGDREAVAWLRSQVDERAGCDGSIVEQEDSSLDGSQNAWVTTTFVDGELASTLRIHVAKGEGDYIPSLDIFGGALRRLLREGNKILETSRLAARLEIAQRVPEMPYIGMRSAWLAAEYFDVDYIISTEREEHYPFYQRAFGYERRSEPSPSAALKRGLTCIGLNFKKARVGVEANRPLLRSSPGEREALFRRWSPPRTVLASR
jgi:hypothetical protein